MVAGWRRLVGASGELLAGGVGLGPLVLFFVQLLEIRERVLILGIQSEDFRERLERAVDEPAPLVVQTEAEQHVGVLQFAKIRALQQRLMLLDGAPDLTLSPGTELPRIMWISRGSPALWAALTSSSIAGSI